MISIRGAREHNLKGIDLTIPRDKLVVFTGLSGSGKSSLAFDTIYAEGQRRYVESLSAYARQFLEMMQKPDVDLIEGLSPAISIEQKTTSKNPRSTVGTVTEIYDYMRLLWARAGDSLSRPRPGCRSRARPSRKWSIACWRCRRRRGSIFSRPLCAAAKGEYRKEMLEFQKKGFQRVKIDGTFYEIDAAPVLDKKFKHDIDVVVDRLVVRPDIAARLSESFETALDLADGIAIIEFADDKDERGAPKRITFSSKFACPVSGFTIPEIEPRLFSFNNPYGACPACDGLGHEMRIDPELVVPDENATLKRGAIAPWARSTSPYYGQTLEALAKHYRFSTSARWRELPEEAKRAILYGSGEEKVRMAYDDGLRAYEINKPFEGVIRNLERRFKETDSEWAREEIGRYMSETPCEACKGMRLKPEALAVKIAGRQYRGGDAPFRARGARLVHDASRRAHGKAERDRVPHLEGDQRSAALSPRCRARIPHLVACLGNLVRRREPAHPPRLTDRLGPHRRALRARRTVDRLASARQRAPPGDAEEVARSRQHGDRGRA